MMGLGRRIVWLTHLGRRGFWLNPASLMVAGLLAVLVLYSLNVHILELIELKTYDLRFVSRGPEKPSGAVAMAVIDEKSLEVEGRWPWPRSKIAALIDALSRDGARVIGFDVIFSEPDENSQLGLIEEFKGRLDALAITDQRLRRFVADRRRAADNDEALAEAIKRSKAAVVLGYFFHDESTLDYRLDPAEIERRWQRIAGSAYQRVRRPTRLPQARVLITAEAPQTNLEMFSAVAASSGYFTLQNDRDGVLRWMPLVIKGGEEFFPPLGLLCAWHYLGRPNWTSVEIGPYGVEGVGVGERFVPTDKSGRLLINYLGRPKTFPHFSVTDILAGKVPAGTFKDRIVLVGATATATYDLRNTPFDPRYPGTEVHATVIDNILTQRFMARPEWSRVFDILAIVAMSTLTGVALTRLSPVNGVLFSAGLAVLYIVVARWLFISARLWLNVVYPLATLLTVYITLTLYHYVTEQRERRRIKTTFKQYVAEHVVEEMTKDPARLRLGGEEKVLTVLFSDLEGFTSYSERYSAHEMTEILAEYYNRMTEQIFTYGGTLKEYVGDELLAFFGAPVEDRDHALHACETALAMRDQRLALVDEWTKIGRPRLRSLTGINSGPMVVGNLGSKYRFAYGVVGDQVNLGSRLEGLNKVYGTDIIISENTVRLLEPGQFVLRELDLVRVLGRAQAIRLYELIGKSGVALDPDHERILKMYAEGLDAYRRGKWSDALALFQQAMTLRKQDGPSRTIAQRCLAYQTNPPDPWDGVFEQQFK